MSVIESLFLGVPVIGANIGGIPEIVKNNHGFLHESGSIDDMLDKIKRALNLSSQEYYHFCENGQKFANEMFSENVHYEKLIEVYSSLIKSRI
jgi:glycosyltransferase involved in cell wall biosynthesis